MGDGLALSVQQDGQVSRVAVTGEIDVSNSDRLSTCLASLVPIGDVVVDAGAVTFIDARGVDALMAAAREARRHGHRLRVVPASANVRRLLALVEGQRLLGDRARVQMSRLVIREGRP